MALKKCPVCGKKIEQNATLCLYCSTALETSSKIEDLDCMSHKNTSRPRPNVWLIMTLLSLVLIVVMAVALWLIPPATAPTPDSSPDATTTTTSQTTPTRDPVRDAWLHSYTGRWYDEESIGKSDVERLGGHTLFIHDILNDQVLFDLYSYSDGDTTVTAAITQIASEIVDDTLHFTFSDDGLGHSGEGWMRFVDSSIQMEVIVHDPLAENEHSIAVNALFMRSATPSSDGVDLSQIHDLADVMSLAGRQTADPVTNDKGETTYAFGVLQAVTDAAGQLKLVTVDYANSEDKSAYCFSEIDGTMGYETVKTFFGEAVHDYIEQPTDIRVLHYTIDENRSVTFTFDAGEDLLIHILYTC